ncbi:MAG: DUF1467 family protein [Asticcacaulis sp.]
MSLLTGTAIYLLIWWITFFAVLPMGNRTPTEMGDVTVKGHDTGAPVTHNIWKKVRLNTLIALGIWIIVAICLNFVHIPLPTIPSS